MAFSRPAALAAGTLILAAACGGSGSVPDPPDDPNQTLEMAAEAMRDLSSARFEMSREGAPVTIRGMRFDLAVGRYAAPDAAEAVLTMKLEDISIQLGTIAIGDRTWLTNPLSGAWEELSTGFNPAIIFDPEIGWVPLLSEDFSDPVNGGIAADGGGDRWVVSGTIGAARVNVLTAGLVDNQDVPATVYLDPETSLVTTVEFTTTEEGEESSWRIVLSDFDEPVTITAPTDG